jgi:hypothetical protein
VSTDDDDVILGHIGAPVRAEPMPTPVLHLFAGRGMTPPENVRPCPHLPHYPVTLDEEYATVTCQRCGEKLSPFSVLLIYARGFERHVTAYRMARDAHRKVALALLRNVREMRNLLPTEVDTLDSAIREAERASAWQPSMPDPSTWEKVARDVRHALRDRKSRRASTGGGRT